LLLALAAGCGAEPDDAGHTSHTAIDAPAESHEEGSAGQVGGASLPAGMAEVEIPYERRQLAGVRTEELAVRQLSRGLRTVGLVVADERRVRRIQTKISGWVEELLVSFTGELVRSGQAILGIYSPELRGHPARVPARSGGRSRNGLAQPPLRSGADAPPRVGASSPGALRRRRRADRRARAYAHSASARRPPLADRWLRNVLIRAPGDLCDAGDGALHGRRSRHGLDLGRRDGGGDSPRLPRSDGAHRARVGPGRALGHRELRPADARRTRRGSRSSLARTRRQPCPRAPLATRSVHRSFIAERSSKRGGAGAEGSVRPRYLVALAASRCSAAIAS